MFMVPGESTVTVPAGKLKVSYQEEYKASSDGDSIDFGVPGQLQVTVTNAATGEQVEIKGPGFRGMGASLDIGSGWSRALVGHDRDHRARQLHGHRRSPPSRAASSRRS